MINNMVKKIVMAPAALCNAISFKIHKVEKGNRIAINGRLRLDGKGKLILGDDVRINSSRRFNPIGGNTFTSIYIKPEATVMIGDNTGMSNIAIYAAEKIEIGRYVKIGGNVSIYDTDFHSVNYESRRLIYDSDVKIAGVKIEDDTFIGAHSTILKGVTIGRRSIIAAGSVVTRNVPEDELWGGTPAKFIKKLKPESEN